MARRQRRETPVTEVDLVAIPSMDHVIWRILPLPIVAEIVEWQQWLASKERDNGGR